MSESMICAKCGYTTTESVAQCPQCKARMLNPHAMKRKGRMQVIMGVCLVAMMSLILVALMLLSDLKLTQRFVIPCVFGIGAGLAAIASGIWLIKYARPNLILILIMLGLILAMVFRLAFATTVGQSNT